MPLGVPESALIARSRAFHPAPRRRTIEEPRVHAEQSVKLTQTSRSNTLCFVAPDRGSTIISKCAGSQPWLSPEGFRLTFRGIRRARASAHVPPPELLMMNTFGLGGRAAEGGEACPGLLGAVAVLAVHSSTKK